MIEELTLKTRIRNGETTIGVRIPWDATKEQIEDIWGRDEAYRFVTVDSQHSPFSEPQLLSICLAAQDLSIPVHFRIKHTALTAQIGNWLDLGPTLIEVPQTETKSTAQEAVDFFYYHPTGRRSWGGAARTGITDRPTVDEYMPWWNRYGVLMLQVESIQAIEKIPYLALNGVDCISWGPEDLRINRRANPDHPLAVSDEACLKYAASQCAKSGVRLAVRSYDWRSRQKYVDLGATVLLEYPR